MRIAFIVVFLAGWVLNLPARDLPIKKENVPFSEESLKKMLEEKRPAEFILGQTKEHRNIEAWFFPGTSNYNALVIGGVHGSELSSIEVTRALIQQLLTGNKGYYNVIVIPSLFPDNALKAMSAPSHIGSTNNIGRYTMTTAVDPNRQMPTPGKAYDESSGLDHLGRSIEIENQLMLQLIQSFKPQRIINVHAIRNTGYGGVYADPRTDNTGIALGYSSDNQLAIAIARYIDEHGGNVNGNNLYSNPTALYYKDPDPVPAGSFQKRNMAGAMLDANRGSGVSLGTWASTAVINDVDPSKNRDAMRIITMEYPGCKRPVDYKNPSEQMFQQKQVDVYASSIRLIFLGNYCIEENPRNLLKK
ncbi:MAG TPA: hypothetical protein VFI06_17635 [Chitinophagaceae bacterium]|nr:hypothetical protein [Chitinophagaceae bacterium]